MKYTMKFNTTIPLPFDFLNKHINTQALKYQQRTHLISITMEQNDYAFG